MAEKSAVEILHIFWHAFLFVYLHKNYMRNVYKISTADFSAICGHFGKRKKVVSHKFSCDYFDILLDPIGGCTVPVKLGTLFRALKLQSLITHEPRHQSTSGFLHITLLDDQIHTLDLNFRDRNHQPTFYFSFTAMK